MHRTTSYVATAISISFLLLCSANHAQQLSDDHSSSQQPPNSGTVSLTISLRLEDNAPFTGQADLHLTSPLGLEVGGSTRGPEGDIVFPSVWPGSYVIEAGAPGFLLVRQNIEIKPSQGPQSLAIVIMKAKPSNDVASNTDAPPGPNANSWLPPSVDESVPEVNSSAPCSLSQVLQDAGERMEEFVDDLDRFSATEHVEHYAVNANGQRLPREVRFFEYVASISHYSGGGIELDEYRNGNMVNPQQFPAGIMTSNLPAHALIFHPSVAPDFNFTCEGLGQWKGHPAWLVHFEEKQAKHNPFRSYVIGNTHYPVQLKGRAWIDADTRQVVRMDTDLVKPITKIHLTREHVSIEYGLVQFQTHNDQLWLPQTADLYVEWGKHRFYRRHTFSDFKVFSVGTEQHVHAPKESYCFINMSGRDVIGTLTVTPVSTVTLPPVSLSFTIPADGYTCKTVGPGKDVNIAPESLATAAFVHDGPQDSVKVDAHLVKEITVEVMSTNSVPAAH